MVRDTVNAASIVSEIMSLPDSTNEHGLIALAESYLVGAMTLQASRAVGRRRMPHNHPDLALAVHAVETALKAVCLAWGMPAAEAKTQMGHDLEKALERAVALAGAAAPQVLAMDMAILSAMHKRRAFFYQAVAPLNLNPAPVIACARTVVNWALPLVLPGSLRQV